MDRIKVLHRLPTSDRNQYCQSITTVKAENTIYSIHAPYATYDPTSLGSDPSAPIKQHLIVADGASLNAQHPNPWIITGTLPLKTKSTYWSAKKIMVQVDDGSWEAREQSPEPIYEQESDDEVLWLDDDVMERDFDTGKVGKCGQRGCKMKIGCVSCQGYQPSPRTTFRDIVARDNKYRAPEANYVPRRNTPPPVARPPLNMHEGYPKHLQRLKTKSIVVDIKPPTIDRRDATKTPEAAPPAIASRKGPKIKYVRKRLVEGSTIGKRKVYTRRNK